MAPPHGWKLVLAIALLGSIGLGVFARAPRQAVATGELKRLVAAAIALYAVGLVASLSHRGELAGLVYASGIFVCSLAVWLSRGVDSEDPPDDGGEDPVDEQPPPTPEGWPTFDWNAFERELAVYTEREPV